MRIVVEPIVQNRWNIAKLHNKNKIKQYSPIHFNGSGRLMSFVTLDLLKLVENYGEIVASKALELATNVIIDSRNIYNPSGGNYDQLRRT